MTLTSLPYTIICPYELDVELINVQTPGPAAVMRQLNNTTVVNLEIRVFDLLLNVPFEQRYKLLCQYIPTQYRVHYHLALNQDNIQTCLTQILAAGGEGIVVRHKHGRYEPGSRTASTAFKLKTPDALRPTKKKTRSKT